MWAFVDPDRAKAASRRRGRVTGAAVYGRARAWRRVRRKGKPERVYAVGAALLARANRRRQSGSIATTNDRHGKRQESVRLDVGFDSEGGIGRSTSRRFALRVSGDLRAAGERTRSVSLRHAYFCERAHPVASLQKNGCGDRVSRFGGPQECSRGSRFLQSHATSASMRWTCASATSTARRRATSRITE